MKKFLTFLLIVISLIVIIKSEIKDPTEENLNIKTLKKILDPIRDQYGDLIDEEEEEKEDPIKKFYGRNSFQILSEIQKIYQGKRISIQNIEKKATISNWGENCVYIFHEGNIVKEIIIK
jgi:hypothetical protein